MAEPNIVENTAPIAKAETPAAIKAEIAKIEAASESAKAPAALEGNTEKATQPAKAAAARVKVSEPAKNAAPAKKNAGTARRGRPRKNVKPALAGVQPLKQGVKTMTKQTEAGVFAADQIKNAFGDVNARAKTAMEKSAKVVEELADLTRGNVEAFVASSKVAAKGVEALSQDAAEFGRKSFEDASAALKSFAEVKSATDFFRLQGDFARSAFDAAVAESARVSEAVLKIAGDVAEPITSRYAVAAERVKTLAA